MIDQRIDRRIRAAAEPLQDHGFAAGAVVLGVLDHFDEDLVVVLQWQTSDVADGDGMFVGRAIQEHGGAAVDHLERAGELASCPLEHFDDLAFIATFTTGADFDLDRVPFQSPIGRPRWNENILGDVGIVRRERDGQIRIRHPSLAGTTLGWCRSGRRSIQRS